MSSIRETLQTHEKARQEILNHFGYDRKWHVYPLRDSTEYYWYLDNNRQKVWWSDDPFTQKNIEEGECLYSGNVYEAYRNGDLECMQVDTQCDRNEFLMVLDDEKRLTDEDLIELLLEEW